VLLFLKKGMVMDGDVGGLTDVATDIEVTSARETWSEYQLADGTVLRLKPIMIGVSRVADAQTLDGEPVYQMKSTLVTDVRVARR
jgi:hypothetical protein